MTSPATVFYIQSAPSIAGAYLPSHHTDSPAVEPARAGNSEGRKATANRTRSSLCGRVWKKFAFDVSLPLPPPAAYLSPESAGSARPFYSEFNLMNRPQKSENCLAAGLPTESEAVHPRGLVGRQRAFLPGAQRFRLCAKLPGCYFPPP